MTVTGVTDSSDTQRILAIDIGAGPQDILIFDAGREMENCEKLVLPSRTQIAARQTETDRDLLRAQLQACATACRICAEECQRHAGKHEHCRLCAESCRLCERACNDLIAAL